MGGGGGREARCRLLLLAWPSRLLPPPPPPPLAPALECSRPFARVELLSLSLSLSPSTCLSRARSRTLLLCRNFSPSLIARARERGWLGYVFRSADKIKKQIMIWRAGRRLSLAKFRATAPPLPSQPSLSLSLSVHVIKLAFRVN